MKLGHAHNTKWTDENVRDGILKCVKDLNLDRMPSRQELHEYFGNDALTNRIRRSGGYYSWASKLNLPMKDSETQKGKRGEQIAVRYLENRGFKVERMTTRYPYDLYINGCVKVDVKISGLSTFGNSVGFAFNLEKRFPTCDFYLLISDYGDSMNFYIVPSVINQTQISIWAISSIYDKFKDRIDLIESEAALRIASLV